MCAWNYEIKAYLQDIGYEGVDWVHVAQSRTRDRFL